MVIQLKEFIKKLILFDVFWGRRSKMFHGIKDGGAKATSIGNPSIAKVWNGNSIFNVNDPSVECNGGHYHTSLSTKVCLNFEITDWLNNQIEIIASGVPVPGQIGPHGLTTANCFEIEVSQDLITRMKKVNVMMLVNKTTKNVILMKSGGSPEFKGNVILDQA